MGAAIGTTFCLISDQWRIVKVGPAKLDVGLFHVCRDGESRRVEFLIDVFIDDQKCMDALSLKEKFSSGSGKIPETLEIHVASCAMMPLAAIFMLAAVITSILSSFLTNKRKCLLVST